MIETDKFILDACCGGKQMWYDKNHPKTLYVDIRKEGKGFYKREPNFEVNPDIMADFRDLPFEDGQFKLVVFDPPHIKRYEALGDFTKKYGILHPDNWKQDLSKAFRELWRVLDDYGVLVFKWNECNIKLKEVLRLFPIKPLFGNKSGLREGTVWSCFMKIPNIEEQKELNKEG